MTVRDFYAVVGGDCDAVLSRLLTEDRIRKYLLKFAANTDYTNMHAALDAQNYEDAFRFVHNLKGMSANLGMTRLFNASSELCELLRGGTPKGDIAPLLAAVDAEYAATSDAISQL